MHLPLRPALQALLWELWRTSRLELAARIGFLLFLAFIIVPVSERLDEPQIQIIRGILVLAFALSSIFSQTWLGQIDTSLSGFSFRLWFIRPLPTWVIVFLPLGYTLVTAGLCYLIPAVFAGIVIGSNLPLISPVLLVLFVVVLVNCVTWCMASRAWKVAGLVLLGSLLAGTAVIMAPTGELPVMIKIGTPEFYCFNFWSGLALTFATIAAIGTTLVAVDRQRRGDAILQPLRLPIWRHAADLLETWSEKDKHELSAKFRNSFAAQCWYEWRRIKTNVLVIAGLAPLLVLAFIAGGRVFHPTVNSDIAIWMGAIGGCPVVFQIIAASELVGLKHSGGVTKLSVFDATRPIRTGRAIGIKILMIASSSLIGTACMLCVGGTQLILSGNIKPIQETWAMIANNIGFPWIALLGLAFVVNFIFSSSALLTLGLWFSLYAKRLVIISTFLAIAVFAIAWDANHGLRFAVVWTACSYFLSAFMLVISIAIIRKAFRLAVVDARWIAGLCAVWIAYLAILAATIPTALPELQQPIPGHLLILGLATLSIAPATLMLAPLAYASHRNH